MLNIPVLRWGKPYESLEVDQVVHFMTGEPIAKVSQANGGLLERDLRKAQQAREALRKFTCDELIERVKKAGELYLNGTLAVGRRQAIARGIRPPAVVDHRFAGPHVRGEHAKEFLRAVAHARNARRADPRPAARHFDQRIRRRIARGDGQLPGAVAGVGAGVAVELARRAHALAAGDSDADRAGAEARAARALDPLSHGGGHWSKREFRPRRFRFIRAAPTSAPRCWPLVGGA